MFTPEGSVCLLLCLIRPAAPGSGAVPGVWCVWANSSRMLSFCPGTDALTLTVRRRAAGGGGPQDDILVLRDKLRDGGVLRLVRRRSVTFGNQQGAAPRREVYG